MDIYYKKTHKTGEEPRIVMELSVREACLVLSAVEIVDPDEDEDRDIASEIENSLRGQIERALEA